MDIKTLMIGDWVYDTLSQTDIKVNRGCFEINPLNGICYAENLSPIPITPEILKKNGFYGGEYKHYCGDVWHLELEGFREIGFTYSNGKGVLWGEKIKPNYPTSIGDKFVIPNITCLHVLQHALRLCGIEKEIEL